MEKYKCPCCGYYTLGEEGAYDVCPVCFWEDDSSQSSDCDLAGGANKICLSEAQKNYREFGACMKEYISFVREPLDDEKNEGTTTDPDLY